MMGLSTLVVPISQEHPHGTQCPQPDHRHRYLDPDRWPDGLMAEVIVDIGATAPVVSVITRSSAESLGLAEGTPVTVVIKSTEVMLATAD